MTEDVSVTFQKGLSEWWSEETEYIFQRIERWAAYARGYNRLRSQRLSRGRMTMQDGQEPRWSISSNKLIIDDFSWSPRFHTLKKSRRKSRPEETKINCCGTFNYQSNSSLDSNCLETYRYDHSIYFKTIGDIKNGKKEMSDTKNEQEDRISISSEELVEWDVNEVSDLIANQLLKNRLASENVESVFDSAESSVQNTDGPETVTWFNVDLSELDFTKDVDTVIEEQNDGNNLTGVQNEEQNNNYVQNNDLFTETSLQNESTQLDSVFVNGNDAGQEQSEDGIQRLVNIRRSRRSSRKIKQAPIAGHNDVIWPSVLLNYTRNIDPTISPHHHRNELNLNYCDAAASHITRI